MKRNILVLLASALIGLSACNTSSKKSEATPSDKAKESIDKWMGSKPSEYPNYKPVDFGELTPRYQRSNKTYHLYNLIEEEKAKANPSQERLDSLSDLLDQNKGEFLGYTILHKYLIKNNTGEIIENENLFFLDSVFRIITILNADAYDQIMNEKLIFRQELPDTLKH